MFYLFIYLFILFRALRALMKNQVLDAFYGNPDPSLLEGGVMPRDFSGESFEMKGYNNNNNNKLIN